MEEGERDRAAAAAAGCVASCRAQSHLGLLGTRDVLGVTGMRQGLQGYIV